LAAFTVLDRRLRMRCGARRLASVLRRDRDWDVIGRPFVVMFTTTEVAAGEERAALGEGTGFAPAHVVNGLAGAQTGRLIQSGDGPLSVSRGQCQCQ
jgi:hypothetical protein